MKYASLVSGRNNALKNIQGNLDGFASTQALTVRRAQEASLERWLGHQTMSAESHVNGAALETDVVRLRTFVDEQSRLRERDFDYNLIEGGGLFNAAYQIVRLADEKQKPDLEREPGFQQRDEIRVLAAEQQLERRMDPGVDQQLFVYALQRYVKLPPAQRLPALDQWLGGAAQPAALAKKVADLYAGSTLADTATRVKWLDATPAQIRASDDAWLKLMTALMPELLAYEHQQKALAGDLQALRPRYMAAMTAFRAAQGKPIYPDANSTLRVSFGTVQGYTSRDGANHEPFTTAEGIVQKDTGIAPFNAPPAELQAIRDKAYDGYASPALGTLPVAFLSNLDITGGNSGSPTLDKQGRLVGLAFDSTWEGVSSGWLFDPAQTRTIHVDARYMLWVMHHLDHADNLLEEMGVPAGSAQ